MVKKMPKILFSNMLLMDKIKEIKRIIQVQGLEVLLQSKKREKIVVIRMIQKIQKRKALKK
jgi:hypothetical protein